MRYRFDHRMIPPVKPGERINLRRFDPDRTALFPAGKKAARKALRRLRKRIGELQQRFYVAHKYKLLVVLQGMDTSGKSGTLRAVFRETNPQGVTVASFKKPTPTEIAHDFLWRIHPRVPATGEFAVFDRSHYEDVGAVRVQRLCPRRQWEKRFDHIRDFERMLADEGTIILKFFLHIDRDEQKQRLESRLRVAHKRWKFDPADLDARRLWDDYMRAYSDAIMRTSTKNAPWYIVPANHKWLRDLIVATIVVDRLKRLDLRFPKIEIDPAKTRID